MAEAAGNAGGSSNPMTFMRRQTQMFKNAFRGMDNSMETQQDASTQLERAGRTLRRVLHNTTRSEMREEFGGLGNNLRNYQRMLRRYNVENADDLERLTRIGARFYDNEDEVDRMQNNFEEALEDMNTAQEGTFDRMRDNLQLLGIANMQGGIDDEASSIRDISNDLKKTTGLDSKEISAFRSEMIKVKNDLNDELGISLLGYADVMDSSLKFAQQLGISDPEVLAKLTKDISILSNASDVSFEISAKALEKLDQRGFTDSDRMMFMDSFVNIVEGQKVEHDKVMGAVNAMEEAVTTFSGGNKDLAQLMNESIMKSAALFETSYLDSEAIMTNMKSAFLDNDVEAMVKLNTQLSPLGMNVNDVKEAFTAGDFDKISADYIKSIGNLMENSSGHNRSAIAEMYGIDPENINKFIASADDSHDALREIDESMRSGAGAIDQASQQSKSLFERMGNWISGIEIFGKDLTSLVEEINMNPLEAYATFMIAKDVFGSLGKSGRWLRGRFTSMGGMSGIGGLLGKTKEFAKGLGTGVVKVASFAGAVGKSAIKALSAFAVTIWTTVIPALIAMAKSAWASTLGRFGGGGRGGRGGRGGAGGGRSGSGGTRSGTRSATRATRVPPIPPIPPGGAGSASRGIMASLGKVKGLGGGLGLLGLGLGGFAIANSDDKTKTTAEVAGGIGGGWAGAAGGAAAGAALGSVVPILGTAVGGILGGLIGGLGGGLGGSWLGGKAVDTVRGDKDQDIVDGVKQGITEPVTDPSTSSMKDIGDSLIEEVPHYSLGTAYVPETGLAYVHEGEAIIPEGMNNAMPLADMGSIQEDDNRGRSRVLEDKFVERTKLQDKSKERFDTESIVEAVEVLTSFMKYWHQDEVDRSRRNERREDPFASQRQRVQQWEV